MGEGLKSSLLDCKDWLDCTSSEERDEVEGLDGEEGSWDGREEDEFGLSG